MRIRVNVCAPVLCIGALATLITLGVSDAARSDDCLTEPNRGAGPGARWLYYTERATNRRCWYLVAAEPRPGVAQPPQPSVNPPPFTFFFPWSSAGPSNPSGPPSDPRAAPGPRPDDPRIDARPRPPRPSSAEVAVTERPPHRPATAAHVETPQARLTPTERDALFRDFLHWQEQQRPQ